MKNLLIVMFSALVASCGGNSVNQANDEIDYTAFVDPRIGTGGHGRLIIQHL